MNLPITLIAHALTHKVVNQLRLYLCLKMQCSGTFKWDNQFVEETCKILNYKSTKTFKRNLMWLIKNKWVAYNSTNRVIRVKSFARLCCRLDIITHTGVWIEIKDLQQFRPFCYAAIYSWAIRKKNWYQRQPGRKEGRPRKSMSKPIFEMPNEYMAKILNLHASTISRYKLAAETSGLITREHKFQDTELPEAFLYGLQKYNPDSAHQLVIWNDTVQVQLPDIIISNIKLKRHRVRPP